MPRDTQHLWETFDASFSELFGSLRSKPSDSSYSYRVQDGALSIELDLPGTKREAVSIVARGTQLVISWKRGDKQHSRTFDVDAAYDAHSAAAKLEDGVLHVMVLARDPKPAAETKIPVG